MKEDIKLGFLIDWVAVFESIKEVKYKIVKDDNWGNLPVLVDSDGRSKRGLHLFNEDIVTSRVEATRRILKKLDLPIPKELTFQLEEEK